MPDFKYLVPAPVRAFRWRYRSLIEGEANFRRKVIRTGHLVRWTVKELIAKQLMFTTPDAAQYLCPCGRVVAIEAHPATFGFLKRNLALNSLHNVVALKLAVGSKEGEIRLNNVSGNPGETHVATLQDTDLVAVKLRSLDAILNELGINEIHYLKIDVEGFEVEVLNGAGSIIRRSPRIVVQTEVVPGHLCRYGASTTKLARVARSYGLIPHCLGSGGYLEPVELSETMAASEVLWLHANGRPVQCPAA